MLHIDSVCVEKFAEGFVFPPPASHFVNENF